MDKPRDQKFQLYKQAYIQNPEPNNLTESTASSQSDSKTTPSKDHGEIKPFPMQNIDKITKHKHISNHIEIHFPYPSLYEPQKLYMDDVILALNSKENALLQSPTGTGKTMSMLCSALAWLRAFQIECLEKKDHFHYRETQIIYATRTHSQCKQVVGQLKKTPYKPVVSILSSRDLACIKNKKGEFKDQNGVSVNLWGESLTKACKVARHSLLGEDDDRRCSYYKPFLTGMGTRFSIRTPPKGEIEGVHIQDIEDMLVLGEKCNICPYYLERHLSTQADIIVMPYNYLIDPNLRETNRMNLANKIIIIDEAHNIEKTAEEAYSFSLRLEDIRIAQGNLFELSRKIKQTKAKKAVNFAHVTNSFHIVRLLNEIVLESQARVASEVSSREIDEIFSIFDDVFKNELLTDKMNLTSTEYIYQTLSGTLEIMQALITGEGISTLLNFVKGVRRIEQREKERKINKSLESYLEAYRLYFVRPTNDDFIIKLKCLTPSLCFKEIQIQRPRSILLTSGTLDPLISFEQHLEVPFKIKRSNKHVIDTKEQCCTVLIPNGLYDKNVQVRLGYSNRQESKIWQEVGYGVIDIVQRIDYGIILAFGSYEIMDMCMKQWKSIFYKNEGHTIYGKLKQIKLIFAEPRKVKDLKDVIEAYYEEAETPQGAIITCVCRGKISEGIDFPDNKARAVIMIGAPLANSESPEVKDKQEYLNERFITKKSALSGSKWYLQDAIRAANQAIGRIIRHEQDYGMVFLFEVRYSTELKPLLPEWVRDNIHLATNVDELNKKIEDFFSTKQLPSQSNMQAEYDFNLSELEFDLEDADQEDQRTVILPSRYFSEKDFEEEIRMLRELQNKAIPPEAKTEILDSESEEEAKIDPELESLSEISEECRNRRELSERLELENHKRVKITEADISLSDDFDDSFIEDCLKHHNELKAYKEDQENLIVLPDFKNQSEQEFS